ncbi:MAG: hypothetical protein R3E84_13955 [Pseudomonadales bacterium]
MNDALPSFACPACGNPLHAWRCNPCNTSYPMLEAVPVLLPEPEMALADWRNRWRLERQRLYAEERRASAAAATAAGIAAARLNHLAAALAKQRACLESLLAPCSATTAVGQGKHCSGFAPDCLVTTPLPATPPTC